MLEEMREKLENEAETLRHELNVVLPAEIEKAVALGDLRENSEYSAALERQRFVQARLDYISRRLSEIMEMDIGTIPEDRVGFGSWVRVRMDSGELEEYILAFADDIDFDSVEISMRSPIGKALLGKREGDAVSVRLPRGRLEFEIVELTTIHELQADGGPPPPSPRRS